MIEILKSVVTLIEIELKKLRDRSGQVFLVNTNRSIELDTGWDQFHLYPISPSDIKVKSDIYEHNTGSTVKVIKDGTYQISRSLSVSNMPSGEHKFVLSIYKGDDLISSVSHGVISLTSEDY